MSIIFALVLGAVFAGVLSVVSIKALLALVPANHKSRQIVGIKDQRIS